jgi:Family of unknown function (DUF6152)
MPPINDKLLELNPETPMKLKNFVLGAMAVAMVAIPAVAHHSYAMFDASKTVTIEGTVKKFQWTNPHSLIFVTVTDASGLSADWAIEHGSPAGLARQGWTPKTLTPGMQVKVVVHPLTDGKPGGQFLAVTLPDGKQLGDPAGRH